MMISSSEREKQMSDRENKENVLVDLIIGILVFAMIIQVIIVIVGNELLYYSVGLWIGATIGATMAWHMKRSIEDALDIGEGDASKHMIKKSLLRNSIVVVLFLILGYVQLGSLLTALMGILGLKISVYFQPYIYKVRRKLRKGG